MIVYNAFFHSHIFYVLLALGQKSSTDHHRMSFLEPCRPLFTRLGIILAMHSHYNNVFTSAYVKDKRDHFQTKAIKISIITMYGTS